jgi:hypothetical protein
MLIRAKVENLELEVSKFKKYARSSVNGQLIACYEILKLIQDVKDL